MKSQSSDTLVLLIHGFMGHPKEMSPLAEYLEQHQLDTHRVCLPAHGDSPGNMGRLTWEAFLETCQADLEKRITEYDQVHVVGFSLGGALSTLLTAENKDRLQSLTLVAAPCRPVFNRDFGQYHMKHFFNRFLPGTQYLHQWDTGYPKPYLLPYQMMGFYQQMDAMFAQVQQAASLIETPTLLIHSPYDLTVPYEHSEWFYQNLPGDVNFLTLLHCGHQVFPFNSRGLVEESILQHVQGVCPLEPTVAA